MLFDESVPRDVCLALVDTGHESATVQSLGWSGMKNGTLLRSAREAGWEVLVTVDRRMEYQQNIAGSGIALVVLRARSTRVVDLLPLVQGLVLVLPDAAAGSVTHVDAG